MSDIECHYCRRGDRDPHTGECGHCGRPLKGPALVGKASTATTDAVEGLPCPTCDRVVPLSGRTRARNARERKAVDTPSGETAGETGGEPAAE